MKTVGPPIRRMGEPRCSLPEMVSPIPEGAAHSADQGAMIHPTPKITAKTAMKNSRWRRSSAVDPGSRGFRLDIAVQND